MLVPLETSKIYYGARWWYGHSTFQTPQNLNIHHWNYWKLLKISRTHLVHQNFQSGEGSPHNSFSMFRRPRINTCSDSQLATEDLDHRTAEKIRGGHWKLVIGNRDFDIYCLIFVQAQAWTINESHEHRKGEARRAVREMRVMHSSSIFESN